MAHGAVGDVQFLGRAREAQMPRRGLEIADGVQGREAFGHAGTLLVFLTEKMRKDRLSRRPIVAIFTTTGRETRHEIAKQ
jgi:hypothetical protein